jgi:hypothetical protein
MACRLGVPQIKGRDIVEELSAACVPCLGQLAKGAGPSHSWDNVSQGWAAWGCFSRLLAWGKAPMLHLLALRCRRESCIKNGKDALPQGPAISNPATWPAVPVPYLVALTFSSKA